MARRSVRWSVRAREDLFDLYDYLRGESSPRAALDFVTRIEERCEQIAEFPRSGKARPDIRSSLRIMPFETVVIAYDVVGDQVAIAQIVHGRRDVEALLRDED
jgi:toxin ParE1/3/4